MRVLDWLLSLVVCKIYGMIKFETGEFRNFFGGLVFIIVYQINIEISKELVLKSPPTIEKPLRNCLRNFSSPYFD